MNRHEHGLSNPSDATHTRWVAAVVMLMALAAAAPVVRAASGLLFSEPLVPRVHIELPPDAMKALRRDPRTYVSGTIREGTNVFREVAVRLKGRKGSFRGLDDKPAFTLDFDQQRTNKTFHNLTKVHLNNSVEDPSFLHELIGTELFLEAGIPAPRVGHALVELNGKRLGLYVVKEGFAPEFLARHFARADGEIFEPEPGAGADVTGPMRRSVARDNAGSNALHRLQEIVTLPNPEGRWKHLSPALDTNRFLSFLAMEILIGHRDGYALAKNNYRIYHDPTTDRLVFLPAGMDQLFGKTRTTLWPRPSGSVAGVVMDSAAGRKALHERMEMLFTNHFQASALTNRIRQMAARLAPELNRSEGRELLREASDLCERIESRIAMINEEIKKPAPGPLEFRDSVAALRYWQATGAPEKGRMNQESFAGRRTLHVLAAPRTSAAWRTKVWLLPGRYRFEALTRLKGVQAITGVRNTGVYLSAPGRDARERHGMAGDLDWSWLMIEFEVKAEDREVELICQVRASAGEVWFDEESLLLRELP